jgi:hypothetical protein
MSKNINKYQMNLGDGTHDENKVRTESEEIHDSDRGYEDSKGLIE